MNVSMLESQLRTLENLFKTSVHVCVQILTEQVCTQVVHKPHPEPDSTVKIQNPSKSCSYWSLNSDQCPWSITTQRTKNKA